MDYDYSSITSKKIQPTRTKPQWRYSIFCTVKQLLSHPVLLNIVTLQWVCLSQFMEQSKSIIFSFNCSTRYIYSQFRKFFATCSIKGEIRPP